MMAYTSVADIFEAIEQVRRSVYDRVAGLAAEQAAFRSEPDGWSPAQLAEHMCVSEERLAGAIQRYLTAAEAEGRPAASPAIAPVSLDRIQEQAKAKFTSPEATKPSGALSIPEILERMRRSREDLMAMRPRLEAIDVSDVTFPHPVFGPLNLYEWVLFVGMHEQRHLRQIDAVMSSPTFPRDLA
jgi:hypothetical protein